MAKAILLLSGGLDSTLAGKLLLELGVEVEAAPHFLCSALQLPEDEAPPRPLLPAGRVLDRIPQGKAAEDMTSDRVNHMGIQLLKPSFEPWSGDGSGREIAVLMSGGVDSSSTALLLKRDGWNVLGITMKMPVAQECSHPRPCCGAEAALVCRHIGVPHYFLDVEAAFDALVVEPFRRDYAEGRTPNPCVNCNTLLKFGIVWDFIEDTFGIRHLATGHYARVRHLPGGCRLTMGLDKARDQSYFIYGLPHDRLSRFVLPLGCMKKPEVRELAREAGLSPAETRDSMELCFAGEGDYRRALHLQSGTGEGPIFDSGGSEIGRHSGIHNYTIGQRRGLKIAAGEPLYVIGINAKDNSIAVGTRDEAGRIRVAAGNANVLIPERLRPGERLFGKIRSYGEASPCTVIASSNGILDVQFDEPQFAPTPGQHLVLYDDDENVVAGGIICGDAGPNSDVHAVTARQKCIGSDLTEDLDGRS